MYFILYIAAYRHCTSFFAMPTVPVGTIVIISKISRGEAWLQIKIALILENSAPSILIGFPRIHSCNKYSKFIIYCKPASGTINCKKLIYKILKQNRLYRYGKSTVNTCMKFKCMMLWESTYKSRECFESPVC